MAKFERAPVTINPLSLFTSLISPETPGENVAGDSSDKAARYYGRELAASDGPSPSPEPPTTTVPSPPDPGVPAGPTPTGTPLLPNHVNLETGHALLDTREVVLSREALSNITSIVALAVADHLAAQAQGVLDLHGGSVANPKPRKRRVRSLPKAH